MTLEEYCNWIKNNIDKFYTFYTNKSQKNPHLKRERTMYGWISEMEQYALSIVSQPRKEVNKEEDTSVEFTFENPLGDGE